MRPMEPKHATTLELPKVLDRLAGLASFSAGVELCRTLKPSTFPVEVKRRLAATTEARLFMSKYAGPGLGGVHDVRPLVQSALRGSALLPQELLDIRGTLVAGRELHRTLSRMSSQFP